MITTVTLNPAIDRTITLDSFHEGAVNRIKSVREDIGGKGINVTKILKSLGYNSLATGFIGNNNKDYVEELLVKEGLSSDFIMVEGQTRLNTKIVALDTKTTTDINEIGFCISKGQLENLKKVIIKYAKKSEMMVFSGSISKGVSENIYCELLNVANRYTKTVLDAEGVFLIEGLKASPYMIKPNIHELENALSIKLDSHEKIKVVAKQLMNDYNIKYILISMGGEGSILVSAEETIFAKALEIDIKSSVGAGDSMLAGFIYGLSNGFKKEKALAYATACGALAASQEGTQSFPKEAVEKLARKVELVGFD